MSLNNSKKINHLMHDWPPGTVYLSSWLKQIGISGQLTNRYKKSGWLESIGSGAVKRMGDEVSYQGALYALQRQGQSSIHVGGKSALELQGRLHFLNLNANSVSLFGELTEHLPKWFSNTNWGISIEHHRTSFLPSQLELLDFEIKIFSIKIKKRLPKKSISIAFYFQKVGNFNFFNTKIHIIVFSYRNRTVVLNYCPKTINLQSHEFNEE